ncbi:MAG: hypothetical protein V3R26_05130 [Hyphomicrobium sp.]
MAKKRRRKHQGKRRTATQPPRRRLWLVGLVVVLVGFGTLLWAPWRQPGTVPPNAIIAAEQSVPAPLFTLPSTSGKSVELAAYLGKQPVVLVFYMGDF